ncbi:hypothetical protein EWM64_g7775 [Hericium alpestre]|uniref:Uncharacterized protein n=1 Tax=Hericium alpestre TaxID=135208 RepID=A0A4Y9ZRV7_9AGAM|nr:hypothetical protein EWM64_g7775 [Hericium alpestre]
MRATKDHKRVTCRSKRVHTRAIKETASNHPANTSSAIILRHYPPTLPFCAPPIILPLPWASLALYGQVPSTARVASRFPRDSILHSNYPYSTLPRYIQVPAISAETIRASAHHASLASLFPPVLAFLPHTIASRHVVIVRIVHVDATAQAATAGQRARPASPVEHVAVPGGLAAHSNAVARLPGRESPSPAPPSEHAHVADAQVFAVTAGPRDTAESARVSAEEHARSRWGRGPRQGSNYAHVAGIQAVFRLPRPRRRLPPCFFCETHGTY